MNRRTISKLTLAAVLVLLPHLPSAKQAPENVTHDQFAEINRGHLMSKSVGKARADTAVDDGTLFQVASCSKTVTSLAVLSLVRDGRLNPHTPVNWF